MGALDRCAICAAREATRTRTRSRITRRLRRAICAIAIVRQFARRAQHPHTTTIVVVACAHHHHTPNKGSTLTKPPTYSAHPALLVFTALYTRWQTMHASAPFLSAHSTVCNLRRTNTHIPSTIHIHSVLICIHARCTCKQTHTAYGPFSCCGCFASSATGLASMLP